MDVVPYSGDDGIDPVGCDSPATAGFSDSESAFVKVFIVLVAACGSPSLCLKVSPCDAGPSLAVRCVGVLFESAVEFLDSKGDDFLPSISALLERALLVGNGEGIDVDRPFAACAYENGGIVCGKSPYGFCVAADIVFACCSCPEAVFAVSVDMATAGSTDSSPDIVWSKLPNTA